MEKDLRDLITNCFTYPATFVGSSNPNAQELKTLYKNNRFTLEEIKDTAEMLMTKRGIKESFAQPQIKSFIDFIRK